MIAYDGRMSMMVARIAGRGGPVQSIQTMLQSVTTQTDATGVRAALTGVVVLLALIAGSWLARRAARVPVWVDPLHWHNGKRKRTGTGAHLSEGRGSLSPWISRITLLCVWLAALVAIANIWFYGQGIPGVTPREAIADAEALGVRIGAALIVVAVSLSVGRVLQRGILTSLETSHVSKNLIVLGGRTIYVCTLLFGLIIVLAIWGTGIVFPVALLGALTVALSLALQDILRNVVAGIYLLVEHPFTIGETISTNTYTGEVEDIQIRVTALRTPDGQRVLIPNALIFTSAVVNLSAYDRRRVGLLVTVPDPGADKVAEVVDNLDAAIRAVPTVLPKPAPQIMLGRVAAAKLELHAVFWVPTADGDQDGTVLAAAIEEIRARLQDAEAARLDMATA